jgi:hypothetical protein
MTLLLGGASPGQMPADAGQVWKTYDIRPFVTVAGAGSQKHVVDWVLQDTGYGSWHGGTVASLTADEEAVRVFHTPEMQARVEDAVRRFTADAGTPHRFSVRVFGIGSPAWRADARPRMQPIAAATPGVQAWIVSRENAAVLVATIRARGDCQELPTGPVLAGNGVPAVLSGGRKRPYVKDVDVRPDVWPGWQTLGASCDEGFAIDIQPLLGADGTTVEAVVRCRIDQIERMAPVTVSAPTAAGQRVQIEVPQVSAVRVGERFRWPAAQCLVIGLGLVPWPVPGQNAGGSAALLTDAKRTDVIVLVEPRLAGRP